MPRMKVTLGIGYSNCNQEDVLNIDECEWNTCKTQEQKNALMHDYWRDWADNYIDGGTEIVE